MFDNLLKLFRFVRLKRAQLSRRLQQLLRRGSVRLIIALTLLWFIAGEDIYLLISGEIKGNNIFTDTDNKVSFDNSAPKRSDIYMSERAHKTAQTKSTNISMNNSMNNKMIPRALIFGNPDYTRVRLSPDGKVLSYIAPYQGTLNLHAIEVDKLLPGAAAVGTVAAGDKPGEVLAASRLLTASKKRPISSYFWTEDSRYLVYLLDDDGDENHNLHFVDFSSGEEKYKVAASGVKFYPVATSEKFPSILLYASNERRRDLFDVYRLDTETWLATELVRNDKYIDLLFDHNLQPRFGYVSRPDGGMDIEEFVGKTGANAGSGTVAVGDSGSGSDGGGAGSSGITLNGEILPAHNFMHLSSEDIYTSRIVGFNQAADKIYLLDSRQQNTPSLFLEDLATRKRQELFQSPESDEIGVFLHPTTRELEYVSTNYIRKGWHSFSKTMEVAFQRFEAVSAGSETEIVSTSRDYNTWVVASVSDQRSTLYRLYRRNEGFVRDIFASKSELHKYDLLPMYPVMIKARDGLDMVSYLTLPRSSGAVAEIDAKSGLPTEFKVNAAVPLILYVHGGPTARDSWGLDPTAQWLANRGYAVLSVNYRGSTGFGKKFLNAGNGEWAGKMHDDLIDAVEWAVSNGIALRNKVAIMGGSYGGYAALVGLTFTPDVFVCGVDIVGPSNLVTLVQSIPSYWKPLLEQLQIKIGGDIETEAGRQALAKRSPLTYVGNIKRPLLIGHGANDPRVKEAESEQLVSALQKKKIPVTYVLYPDEGHGFARPENKMSFYAITEQFLARCLGYADNFEPINEAELAQSSAKFVAGKELVVADGSGGGG